MGLDEIIPAHSSFCAMVGREARCHYARARGDIAQLEQPGPVVAQGIALARLHLPVHATNGVDSAAASSMKSGRSTTNGSPGGWNDDARLARGLSAAQNS